MIRLPRGPQTGFTIVELMIATLVFSVMLLVITAGVLNFTRQYYHGVIESRTQNTARTVIDAISQAIQFGGGAVSSSANGSLGYICAGSQVFYYQLGNRIGSVKGANTYYHALLEGSTSSGCPNKSPSLNLFTTPAPPKGMRELLSPNMRLAMLRVAGSSLYKIKLRVAYGAGDLMCSPSIPKSNCGPGSVTLQSFNLPDLECKSGAGSQFCAVSELDTEVEQRVQ